MRRHIDRWLVLACGALIGAMFINNPQGKALWVAFIAYVCWLYRIMGLIR